MEAIYLGYFGLHEAPFSITPDPAFVYLSQRHRDALAHLMYGVGQGGGSGFVQLTGEVGTGKTTLCRCVLDQVPDNTRIALILNPLMSPRELLESICDELGVDRFGSADSNKALVDRLNHFLLEAHAAGQRVVVIVDEAQNLSPEALEQIRLLTNLETSKQKLLQIVLLGQPELRDLLQRRSLRQLAQRITARYHLTPLSREDTERYVRHRMQVAGAERDPFRSGALRALYHRSGGIPRLINIIADRALLAAYAQEKSQVDSRLVHAAADEVSQGEGGVRGGGGERWGGRVAALASLALALATFLLWPDFDHDEPAPSTPPAVVEVSPPAVVTPAADPDPQPEFLDDDWDDDWLTAQHRQAYTALAELWGDPLGGGAIARACAGERGTGYACLREDGNWALIRRLDLPVILVLQRNESRHLLLRGMDGRRLLVGADGPRTLPRAMVENDWLGQFLVAWPQPDGWPRQLRQGENGPAVDIVLEMAGQADPPYRGTPEFGTAFESWLRAFQRRNGLDDDGIVGPNTLLRLLAPTLSEPRLLADWSTLELTQGD